MAPNYKSQVKKFKVVKGQDQRVDVPHVCAEVEARNDRESATRLLWLNNVIITANAEIAIMKVGPPADL